ncbi:MAG TPA: LysM domain-containing protein [Solirubrobacteraceae bacterium]|jgi:LysM repeat protein|nr:LysM domain-containing protein [Solirubrobacteraceae bacterium]
MAGRSPARFLAPLALVGFALALFLVVSSTTKDTPGEPGVRGTSAPAQATPAPSASKQRNRSRKTYTIKSGDTPSGIAVKVDVPLDQILELNPDLDPQTLTPGTKIKLR